MLFHWSVQVISSSFPEGSKTNIQPFPLAFPETDELVLLTLIFVTLTLGIVTVCLSAISRLLVLDPFLVIKVIVSPAYLLASKLKLLLFHWSVQVISSSFPEGSRTNIQLLPFLFPDKFILVVSIVSPFWRI